MTKLGLQHCTQLTGPAVAILMRPCLALLELCLGHIPELGDQEVTQIASQGGKLKLLRLDATACGSVGLEALAKGCPSLEKVWFDLCVNVVDHGVATILHQCQHLRWLSLCSCPGITGALLRGIPGSTSLQKLAMRNCPAVTKGAAKEFRQRLPKVELTGRELPIRPQQGRKDRGRAR